MGKINRQASDGEERERRARYRNMIWKSERQASDEEEQWTSK